MIQLSLPPESLIDNMRLTRQEKEDKTELYYAIIGSIRTQVNINKTSGYQIAKALDIFRNDTIFLEKVLLHIGYDYKYTKNVIRLIKQYAKETTLN